MVFEASPALGNLRRKGGTKSLTGIFGGTCIVFPGKELRRWSMEMKVSLKESSETVEVF